RTSPQGLATPKGSRSERVLKRTYASNRNASPKNSSTRFLTAMCSATRFRLMLHQFRKFRNGGPAEVAGRTAPIWDCYQQALHVALAVWLLTVGGVEAFGEPVVDFREHCACFVVTIDVA